MNSLSFWFKSSFSYFFSPDFLVEKIASKKEDKKHLLGLICSTIDLVVEADFSISFLQSRSRFSVADPSNASKASTCMIFPNRLDNMPFYLQLYPFIVVSQLVLCHIPSIVSFIKIFFIRTVSIKARLYKVWFVRTGFRSKIFVLILKFLLLCFLKNYSPLIDFSIFLTLHGAYGNLSDMMLMFFA